MKIHRTYSVEEVSRLFGIHKNTVRNWLKRGLAVIDGARPTLVFGLELARFLRERRNKAKQSGPGRIFCLACRAPKVPAGQLADCVPVTSSTGNLCGICPDCDRMIYRRVNLRQIDVIRGELEITITHPRARLGERASPSLNCDSSAKA